MKKRCLSLLLAAVLLLTLLSASAMSVLAADASRDYQHELWLLLGKERAMSRGTVTVLQGAPFSPTESPDTAYLPLDTVALYAGAKVERAGSAITLTRGEDTYSLTVGSVQWKKNGVTMTPFLLNVLSVDGTVYVSILSANALFGLKSYFDRSVGLIVLSEKAIAYREGDKTSLKIEVANTALFLFEYPSGAEIFSDVDARIGEGTYPRLLVDQTRFDALRALFQTAEDETAEITDEDEIRLRTWIATRVRQTGNGFRYYFLEVTADGTADGTLADGDTELPSEPGIYAKDTLAGYYRHPYYFYTADGQRLLGLGGKTIHKQDGYGRRIDIESVFLPDGSLRTDLTDADGTPLDAIYDERGYRVLSIDRYETLDSLGAPVIKEKDYSFYGEGNDVGGRLNTSVNLANFARDLAFVYQVTGEKKYAEAVYWCFDLLGDYEHWGANHFLNCADTANAAALAYDWTYHAFDDEPQKRAEMASILYEKGLKMGYISMLGRPQDGINYHSFVNNYRYYNTENNWNTVCNAGMILSALVLYDYEEYRPAAEKVSGEGLASLKKCLLQYAPDGAYIESPGYWYYGTSTYMILLAALEHAAGTTYGYLDTIGLYDSFYFAQYITSPSGYYWNYHDSGKSKLNLDLFYMASYLYGDPSLAAYRDASFAEGGSASLYDILFYSPSLSEGGEIGGDLDYYMKGIETVTMRSQWSGEGYTFAGLHAGANIATHGDHDSGNFYLEMGGTLWFGDAGAEDYNVADYWGTERRYRYFTKSQEAHNTIVIRSEKYSLRFGQVHNNEYQPHATIETLYSEKNGAYAVADMTPQYGDTCLSGKRGLLFTNARRTVVLQDEISFSEPTSLTWLAAPNLSVCSLRIAEDGRTAYLTSNNVTGKKKILRLTLLSEDESLVFTTVEEKLLDYTIVKDAENPKASLPTKRLAIHADSITSFRVAVLFDLVEEKDDIPGYAMCDIADWSVTDDAWLNAAQDAYDKTKPNQFYRTGDLVAAVKEIEEAELSHRMPLIAAAFPICADMDLSDPTAVKYIAKYNALLEEINAMIRKANHDFSLLNGKVLTKKET